VFSRFPGDLADDIIRPPGTGKVSLLEYMRVYAENMILELHGKGTLPDILRQQDQTDCPHRFHQPRVGPHVELHSRCKDHQEVR
jgi:hypothetical protein